MLRPKVSVSTRETISILTSHLLPPPLPAFFPATTGTSYKLPELLQPLQTVRELFTVIEGLDHQLGGGHKGVQGFLTGERFSFSKSSMYSMDQYAADRIGNDTRFPSLTLDLHGSNYWSWNRYGVKMRGIGDHSKSRPVLVG